MVFAIKQRYYDEKKSRIFSAAERKDIEELKSLLNSPKWFTAVNTNGFNLLQNTIVQENKDVFDFLLSIGFPLDAANSRKTCALIMSLNVSNCDEYYATKLIQKGANVHSTDDKGNTLLHLAAERKYCTVCRLLLEKGVEVNAQNYEGKTPFEMLPLESGDVDSLCEITAMLLYYGADVFPPNGRPLGHILETFLVCAQGDLHFGEIIFDYVVDEHSNYEIDSDDLFNLMWLFQNCPLLYKIINKMSYVIENDLTRCATELFLEINSNYMKLLLEKFDYLISSLLKCCLGTHYTFYMNSESPANFAVLLESHLVDDAIEFVNYLGITGILRGCIESECDLSTAESIIYHILPYLSTISGQDMNLVYRQFGYNDLFKALLHMDISIDDIKDHSYDVMPGKILNVNLNLEKYFDPYIGFCRIDDPYGDGIPPGEGLEGLEIGCSVGGVDKLLNYFADPIVKNFCYDQDIEQLVTKVKRLPQVPLLQELARESCRKFLVAKYNITTSRQFYTILNWLPISPVHKKIISYETALYRV